MIFKYWIAFCEWLLRLGRILEARVDNEENITGGLK